MNVDVVQNDVSSRFIAVGRNFSNNQSSTTVDRNVVFWICLIVGLVTVPVIVACLCKYFDSFRIFAYIFVTCVGEGVVIIAKVTIGINR